MKNKKRSQKNLKEEFNMDAIVDNGASNINTSDVLRNPSFKPRDTDMKAKNRPLRFKQVILRDFSKKPEVECTCPIHSKQNQLYGQYGYYYDRNHQHSHDQDDNIETDDFRSRFIQALTQRHQERTTASDDYSPWWYHDVNIEDEEEVESSQWEEEEETDQDQETDEPEDAEETESEPDEGEEVEQPEDVEDEDPDRQGLIRTVADAHLVYKRRANDSTYEELWVYNVNDKIKNELEIRKNILAGTDIPHNKRQSEDGNQQYTLTTMGNAQLLHITGLPN